MQTDANMANAKKYLTMLALNSAENQKYNIKGGNI